MSTIPSLRPSAAQEHIDAAYCALAKRPHPDQGEDQAAKQFITEAYDALQREALT